MGHGGGGGGGGKMVGDLVENLKKIAEKFPDRVAAALYTEANLIMTESKRRCPVAPGGGQLRASARVAEPERHGKNISVTMSYGGGVAEDYALAVHEHPSEHSPPSWSNADINWTTPGTGPKFLEGPINEARATLGSRLAERIHLEKAEL